MTNFEKAEKSLATILKKGDLYDVISLKEGKNLPKYSFCKIVALYGSRILLGGIFIVEKIKSLFVPVEKVKNAQDEIRKIIEVPIDIICYKPYPFVAGVTYNYEILLKKSLSILYKNEGVSLTDYIENLKKILSFCNLHKIDRIFLCKEDVCIIEVDFLESVESIKYKNILKCYNKYNNEIIDNNIKKYIEMEFYIFNLKKLNFLISELETYRIDKQVLLDFNSKIKDSFIQKNIFLFLENNNLKNFMQIIKHRLYQLMNEDNLYKDKKKGKVYQEIKIIGEFLHIISIDKKGEFIKNQVLSFYDYFDILDYKTLLDRAKILVENKDLYYLSALYLYLIKNEKIKKTEGIKEYLTFYDFIYTEFTLKKNKKLSKISGLYLTSDRIKYFVYQLIDKWIILFLLYGMVFLITALITLLKPNKIWNIDKFLDCQHTIDFFVEESFSFEKRIVDGLLKKLGIDFDKKEKEEEEKMNEFVSNQTSFTSSGDVSNLMDYYSKNIVGTITPLKENVLLPKYFAYKSANEFDYKEGQINYLLKDYILTFFDIKEATPLFKISHTISKKDLNNCLFVDTLWVTGTLYPVGDNYVLTSITFVDKKDENKKIIYDRNRLSRYFTYEEKQLLSSMEEIEIQFAYGISLENENLFTQNLPYKMYKDKTYSSLEIREAIIKGLKLSKDVTNEEIFFAIQNKKYSKTPIQDANLEEEIKSMNELEFFSSVASMDSLICNLAATLAVGVDDELIYITGYVNNDDLFITSNEAHAWAMNRNGEIVDITPSESYHFLRDTFYTILAWGIENNIAFYAVLLLIGVFVKKKLGKKIVFVWKEKRLEKLILSSDIENAYAMLNEFLYGGINISVKRKPEEFVEKISRDFYSFTEEELRDLKKKLLIQKEETNKSNQMKKLVNNISFIKENEEELVRILKRKTGSNREDNNI